VKTKLSEGEEIQPDDEHLVDGRWVQVTPDMIGEAYDESWHGEVRGEYLLPPHIHDN